MHLAIHLPGLRGCARSESGIWRWLPEFGLAAQGQRHSRQQQWSTWISFRVSAVSSNGAWVDTLTVIGELMSHPVHLNWNSTWCVPWSSKLQQWQVVSAISAVSAINIICQCNNSLKVGLLQAADNSPMCRDRLYQQLLSFLLVE